MFLCEVTNPIWWPCIIWQDLLRKKSIFVVICTVQSTDFCVNMFYDTYKLSWSYALSRHWSSVVCCTGLTCTSYCIWAINKLNICLALFLSFFNWLSFMTKKKNWWQEWDLNPWQKAVLHRSVRHSANWPMEDSLNSVVQITAFCMLGAAPNDIILKVSNTCSCTLYAPKYMPLDLDLCV